ncbi:MAG TPA: hypothetical protein PKU79_10655, partial [Mesotoga sp.]|nr:hypothetical protein [Mesotoga sp.]
MCVGKTREKERREFAPLTRRREFSHIFNLSLFLSSLSSSTLSKDGSMLWDDGRWTDLPASQT